MLVRHNWIEIFFRLAMSKYVRITKEAQTPSEAIQMLIDQWIKPKFSKFSSDSWRRQYLYKEEVDLAFKYGLKSLKEVYK